MRSKILFFFKYIVPYMLLAIILLKGYSIVQSGRTLDFTKWTNEWAMNQGEEILVQSVNPPHARPSYYEYLLTKKESVYTFYIMEIERNWLEKPIGYQQVKQVTYNMETYTGMIESMENHGTYSKPLSFEASPILVGTSIRTFSEIKRDVLLIAEPKGSNIKEVLDPNVLTSRFETLYEVVNDDGYTLRLCRTYNEDNLPYSTLYSLLDFYQVQQKDVTR